MRRCSDDNNGINQDAVASLGLKLLVGAVALICLMPILELCSPVIFSVAMSALIADLIALTFVECILNDDKIIYVKEPKVMYKIGHIGRRKEYTLCERECCEIHKTREDEPKREKRVKEENTKVIPEEVPVVKPINRKLARDNDYILK